MQTVRILKLVFIFIVMSMVSCVGDKKIDLPISDERLVDLVVDMHYIEAIVQKTNKVKRDSVRTSLKNQLVRMYNFKGIDELNNILGNLQSTTILNKKIVDQAESVLDSLEKLNKNNKISDKQDQKKKDLKEKKK